MTHTYPNEKIEEENSRLMELFLDSDDDLSLEEFIERNASAEFKRYLKESEERKKRLWEEEGEIEE